MFIERQMIVYTRYEGRRPDDIPAQGIDLGYVDS